MKIAIISELYGTQRQGGENQAMHNLYNNIKNEGYLADFYSYKSENQINSIIPLKIRCIPFIRDILFAPIIGKNLIKRLDKDYDYIIISTPSLASLSNSKKIICWTHACRTMKAEKLIKERKYKLIYNKITLKIIKYLEDKSFNKLNKILVITEPIGEFIKVNFNIDKSKIIKFENIIDKNLFKPIKTKKIYDLIFVGRGTKQKGFDKLIEIAKQNKNLKILAVVNILEFKNIPHNIDIKYNIKNDEMPKYYNLAKTFILPSLDEEQPLTILEAASCGLKILASKEALKNFENIKKSEYGLYAIRIVKNKSYNRISKELFTNNV